MRTRRYRATTLSTSMGRHTLASRSRNSCLNEIPKPFENSLATLRLPPAAARPHLKAYAGTIDSSVHDIVFQGYM